jgi:hypothetical protein
MVLCFSVSFIRFSGSVVFCLVFLPVVLLFMVACPFLICMVVDGEKPMNEYWASFFGPSMDSKIYAFL